MAQRDEDTALLKSAQLDLKRYQSLAKSSFAPVQQVEDQQATVDKQIGADRRRQCADRDGADQPGLLRHPRAVRRARQFLPVECRQPGAGGQPDRHHFDHPGQADLGGAHPAGSRPAAHPGTRGRRARCRSRFSTAAATAAAGDRNADDAEQHDRHRDRNDLAEGELRQPGRPSLAGPVRQRAGPGRHAAQRGHGPGTGGPAWAGRARSSIPSSPTAPSAQTNVRGRRAGRRQTVISQGLSGQETVVVSGQSRLAPGARVSGDRRIEDSAVRRPEPPT